MLLAWSVVKGSLAYRTIRNGPRESLVATHGDIARCVLDTARETLSIIVYVLSKCVSQASHVHGTRREGDCGKLTNASASVPPLLGNALTLLSSDCACVLNCLMSATTFASSRLTGVPNAARARTRVTIDRRKSMAMGVKDGSNARWLLA